MRVCIDIEMIDNDFTIESLKENMNMSEDEIKNTYNNGLSLILEKFGDCNTPENIHVNTQLYDNNFDVKNNMIQRTDFMRIQSAINIINDMIAIHSGGQTIDGIDYVDLFMLESKELYLDAVNLLKDFINKYGISLKNIQINDGE